jgi:hypothetical protein
MRLQLTAAAVVAALSLALTGATADSDPVIAAAGDISCLGSKPITATTCHQRAVSDQILGLNPDAVLTLGDTQYQEGTLAQFNAPGAFNDTYGRFKPIIRPAVGNHEYQASSSAAGYSDYFGAQAGPAGQLWYSYDLGTWHLIVLNSMCAKVGGCSPTSPQGRWLQADLAAHPNQCTLAYWHHPRFTSGQHGDLYTFGAMWNQLANAGVDVTLSGHNHAYERFAPAGVTPTKAEAPALNPTGTRSFVVGTGGASHDTFTRPPLAGEEVRNTDTFGVLQLTLSDGSYSWEFLPEGAGTFTDSGTGVCH